MVITRFEIYIVNLNPTVGSEIRKRRPCVIVSPDDMNKYLETVIIAPLTSTRRVYPSRINCKLKGRADQIALDQIRVVSKKRIKQRLGIINEDLQNDVLNVLIDIFSR